MKSCYVSIILLFTLNAFGQVSTIISPQSHREILNTNRYLSQVANYNVSHYNIHIDTINFATQQIKAHTGVTVVATSAIVNSVQLDLLGFNIDSIVMLNNILAYSYNDTVLDITINPTIAINDSAEIMIYYNGSPALDLSGWGGFYFSGVYAFNLGVGFAADPHNFGRAWFPCIDSFTSRSTYSFFITTAATSKAFCNGTLQQAISNPNGTVTWHWEMYQTIPSYLASMAVAPYVTMNKISNGIPVQWAALPADTNNVNATFSNLDAILGAYINAYGPYPFDKVGFCLVPFNSGAMEHATSIHVGRLFINGSQTYSTLWAHELSHMWWGDKVTCESESEMWLNEGFATYNEAFYNQVVNGQAAYTDWIRANHRKVLQFAHTPSQDGSYLTLNNIPHAYTYGYHVYQKGADVIHTMRNYMGDSAFYNGCKTYMANKAYGNATSYNLRDELTSGSGINMNQFFDDWVTTPGFPHISIDSVVHISAALEHMYIYTRQRSVANNHLYKIPVEINLTDGVNDTTVTVVIDSLTNVFHIPLAFTPTFISLDRFEKIGDAISSNEKPIYSIGIIQIPETNVSLNVIATVAAPSLVRVEHNFVAPDPFISNPGIRISDYHYWKIDGIFTPGFYSKATFTYDGSTSNTTGYLDNTLITGTEDSLVILYREKAGMNWQVVNGFTKNTGASLVDKRGTFTVDTLMKGEYATGYYDYTTGINEITLQDNHIIEAGPNPSDETIHFSFNYADAEKLNFTIYDSRGEKIYNRSINNSDQFNWNCKNIASGNYTAIISKGNKKIASKKLIVNH